MLASEEELRSVKLIRYPQQLKNLHFTYLSYENWAEAHEDLCIYKYVKIIYDTENNNQ